MRCLLWLFWRKTKHCFIIGPLYSVVTNADTFYSYAGPRFLQICLVLVACCCRVVPLWQSIRCRWLPVDGALVSLGGLSGVSPAERTMPERGDGLVARHGRIPNSLSDTVVRKLLRYQFEWLVPCNRNLNKKRRTQVMKYLTRFVILLSVVVCKYIFCSIGSILFVYSMFGQFLYVHINMFYLTPLHGDAYMRQRRRSPRIMACHLFIVMHLLEPMLTYCQMNSLEWISVNFLWRFWFFVQIMENCRQCVNDIAANQYRFFWNFPVSESTLFVNRIFHASQEAEVTSASWDQRP